nr:putative carbohydrate binding domain containing protein [uncultured Mediterranean phage uvMED]
MSEIKVNSIKGVGASAAAITVNNTDGTCTANITNKPNRNLIINGAMQVAQRGTSSTASGYGTVDRMNQHSGGTDEAPTFAQVDVAAGTTPYTLGFRKAFKITNGNQTSGAGTSDYVYVQTILESQDIANSGWNYLSTSSYITISYWIKSSVAQNFYGLITSSDGTSQAYVWETGSLSADTWTKITKTIPGNSNLTFDNDNGAGMYFSLVRAFDGTARTGSMSLNSWAAYSGSARTPDQTSTWYTTNDATLEITGVQLEVSSVATDFEHRSFGQELSLCQRYYCNFLNYDGQGTNPESNLAFAVGTWYNSTYIFCPIRFPVPMRTAPTMESSNNTSDFYALYGAHVDMYNENGLLQASNMGARIYPIVGTANQGSSGVCTVLHVENPSTTKLRFTAEL